MIPNWFDESKPLSFIDDNKLEEFARNLLQKIQTAAEKQESYLYKNVLDPFSAAFDAFRQKITLAQWLEQEKSRQIQKTLQNYIGDFHQNIIGEMPGWENLKVGKSIDLRNREKKIIAEIKNKYNTMNSSSALAIYDKLQRHLDYDESYKGFTAYCVVIIPKSPRSLNITFHPSERGTNRPERENIRIIDGKSFYEIASGDSDALKKIYIRLALILCKITGTPPKELIKGNLLEDLFKRAYIKR